MAQAIIVTLEKELPDAMAAYVKAKSGKASRARRIGSTPPPGRCSVTPPTALLSESHAVLIAQMKEEGFDPSKMRLPPEQWFAAAEGLKTTRGLGVHIYANLNDFKQPNPILRDLKAVEELLVAAEAAGVRFHFTKATT